MAESVQIREVGMRDGLQSIADIMPTETKLAWLDAEYAAGVREIEVSSFVPPKLLPQLADAEAVVKHALTLPELTVSALIPNSRGAERGLALDAVPEGIDAAAVRAHLAAVPGVAAIHDLHIWGMSTTETALTCHLVMPSGHPGDAALGRIAHELEERFGIHHATIQIELGDSDEACVLTPESVV